VSEPIVVEVRRNGVVEAAHRVHAVAVRSGDVVAAAGDPSLTCFMRSSSKPLQALPLVRARDDLPDDELAIACASHHDTPEQVAAAVIRGIERDRGDIDVAPFTMRVSGWLAGIAPGPVAAAARRLDRSGVAEKLAEGQRTKR